MGSMRKGRNFELYMHTKLKSILSNDVHIQKWSGTLADPGDLYTDIFLFDCKHVNRYSENDIRNWYKKLTKEASINELIPILILRRTRSQSIQIIFDIKWIPGDTTYALARFYWKEGTELLKAMEVSYTHAKTQ